MITQLSDSTNILRSIACLVLSFIILCCIFGRTYAVQAEANNIDHSDAILNIGSSIIFSVDKQLPVNAYGFGRMEKPIILPDGNIVFSIIRINDNFANEYMVCINTGGELLWEFFLFTEAADNMLRSYDVSIEKEGLRLVVYDDSSLTYFTETIIDYDGKVLHQGPIKMRDEADVSTSYYTASFTIKAFKEPDIPRSTKFEVMNTFSGESKVHHITENEYTLYNVIESENGCTLFFGDMAFDGIILALIDNRCDLTATYLIPLPGTFQNAIESSDGIFVFSNDYDTTKSIFISVIDSLDLMTKYESKLPITSEHIVKPIISLNNGIVFLTDSYARTDPPQLYHITKNGDMQLVEELAKSVRYPNVATNNKDEFIILSSQDETVTNAAILMHKYTLIK